MTLPEAQAILAGPLQFGDSRQISALQFVCAVDHARDHIKDCRVCLTGRMCDWAWVNYSGNDAWDEAQRKYFSQEAVEAALINGETHL